eukprot:Ihof_evm2s549 gene=Ihof_evmTU2s549
MPAKFTSLNREVMPWATIDPYTIDAKNPGQLYNLVNGEWCLTKASTTVIDPLNGDNFLVTPETSVNELDTFVKSLNSCPKSGLHNLYKNPERYVMYGAVTMKMAAEMHKPEVEEFFTKMIQRVCPKHFEQARGEVTVSRTFLENFCGDNVRFLAEGSFSAGSYLGQRAQSFRWPFGPVMIISPFNFPLEIPVLQLMGALYMGNKVTVKAATTTAAVLEQFIRFMHYCGVPKTDVDFLNCGGRTAGKFIEISKPRVLQFTGSSSVAEQLAIVTKGKIRIEDAGFDWKILGPDVSNVEYVAWQCDQDAYANSGQKCSAQSILFAHKNWMATDLLDRMAHRASLRRLEDLTIAPILSHSTSEILDHMNALLKIKGAKVLFGGKPLTNHNIPTRYGAVEPTAVFVPIEEAVKSEHFGLVTTEIFGPFQVVMQYNDDELDLVLDMCERMEAHLTAAIVSNCPIFQQKIMGSTVNGTTYVGNRARCTGAPQNHWFGPAGDPRGA